MKRKSPSPSPYIDRGGANPRAARSDLSAGIAIYRGLDPPLLPLDQAIWVPSSLRYSTNATDIWGLGYGAPDMGGETAPLNELSMVYGFLDLYLHRWGHLSIVGSRGER